MVKIQDDDEVRFRIIVQLTGYKAKKHTSIFSTTTGSEFLKIFNDVKNIWGTARHARTGAITLLMGPTRFMVIDMLNVESVDFEIDKIKRSLL